MCVPYCAVMCLPKVLLLLDPSLAECPERGKEWRRDGGGGLGAKRKQPGSLGRACVWSLCANPWTFGKVVLLSG